MSSFNFKDLSVTHHLHVTSTFPVDGRKYTLTHSDLNEQLFLNIGFNYTFYDVNKKLRHEVIAKWTRDPNGEFILFGKVYICNGEFDKAISSTRFSIFQEKIKTALAGIIYGDKDFYLDNPAFLDCPIYIHYDSVYPEFHGVVHYSTPRKYLNDLLHPPIELAKTTSVK